MDECRCRQQVKVDSEEHLRKAGGRLRWVQLRRWLEKRAGGFEMLTLRCVASSRTASSSNHRFRSVTACTSAAVLPAVVVCAPRHFARTRPNENDLTGGISGRESM